MALKASMDLGTVGGFLLAARGSVGIGLDGRRDLLNEASFGTCGPFSLGSLDVTPAAAPHGGEV